MKKYLFAILTISAMSSSAHAALRIFACEPEWAAVAHEIGGDKIEATSATAPDQDVHYIQARPSLIAQVRRADLVFCTGADLEVGWLPVLLRQAGNGKVQPGQPGYFEASSAVQMLEVPTSVDRSQGDIHPYGNPHIQTDPRNIEKVAAALSERLAKLDAANAKFYEQRAHDFLQAWRRSIEKWTELAKPLRGMQIVTHHRSYVYLEHWLGIEELGNLEPKPGIEPTTGHLAELLDQVRNKIVKAIVRSSYQDSRASDWLAGRTGVKAIVLPHTVGSVPGTDTLTQMFDVIIARLLEANATRESK
ncbi:MAG TPA: zinc ABC transporter substrate-binding protein [Steroidobacteraceae bacterium]|nr:zinc ABC transporter substrate-binding protein [Steroidobacteraceae bacterium]